MTPVTLISNQQFAVIDFESAGASRGRTDVPVQVGIALWSPSEGLGESLCSFLSTNQKITWSARRVHRISDQDLAGAPSLLSLWPEIRRFLADRVVVAHGHGTEKRFLRAFPGHSFGPWIDTLSLSRAAWPELPSFALGDLCEQFNLVSRLNEIHADRRWHDALYDASASALLLDHLIGSLGLVEKPLDLLLHPDLSTWQALRRS
ncbi:MAG: 3'-5' exonuclease [Roseibacillus sp.]|nr:3'-5' exonuclease [Roseibacillus sp.]